MRTLILVTLLTSSFAWAQNEYRVPVSKELEAFANFQIETSEVENVDGVITLTYDLPKELVGEEKNSILLQGSAELREGQVLLTGPKGDAVCEPPQGETLICSVLMKNLDINPSSVEKVLQKISSTPQELAARMQVAEIFRGEPAGIVIYRD